MEYHTLLPQWAQDALRAAAAVEDTPEAPRAKDCAIEAALHEIRLRCEGALVAPKVKPKCLTSKETTTAKKSGSRTTG